MKKINCNISSTTGTIIDQINDFPINTERQTRISNSKATIDIMSTQLKDNFKNNSFAVPRVAGCIDANKDDMISLYKEKFYKSRYYNLVVAPYSFCPVCEISYVETIDHYFPKSVHYLFSVTPENLIPMCFQCNLKKKEIDPSTSSFHIFHAFYDDMRIQNYLKMNFTFDGNKNFVPTFSIDPCVTNDVMNNYNLFGLKKRYELEAVKIFHDNYKTWKYILSDSGESLLITYFNGHVTNGGYNNPIEKPFYKSMVDNFDLVVDYLCNI